MTSLHDGFSRRNFLGLLGVSATAAMAAGALSGCAPSSKSFNWLTWPNHYVPEQLEQARKASELRINPVLFEDNAIGFQKATADSSFDAISADALWVPKYLESDLIQPFQLDSIGESADLFSVAQELPFWQSGSDYLAYPMGWSMTMFYYNPKYVGTVPDSWEALLDPQYKGKIVIPNSASAIMANAGVAVGAADPMDMTAGELADAKEYLTLLKPNIAQLTAQDDGVIRSLADESAWIGLQWLGTEYRVQEAGGPVVKGVVPREGTTGWIDGEMLPKNANPEEFGDFVDSMMTPEWTAELFLKYGNPYMNEKAYKILVDNGYQERADASLYTKPETVLEMRLWGPAGDQQAYTDTFNEVFGA